MNVSFFQNLLFKRGGFILLVTALLLAPDDAHSQNFRLGGRSGLNFSTFQGDTEVLTENVDFPRLRRRTSYHAGGFAMIELSRWLVLQPELFYIQKGAVLEGSFIGSLDITGTYRFSYLQAPLLLTLRYPLGKRISPILFAGPSFALNTASGIEVDFDEDSRIRSFEEVITTTNMGGVFGAGIHLSVSDSQLMTIDIRYNPGIKDIASEEGVQLRTNTIILSLGYAFSL